MSGRRFFLVRSGGLILAGCLTLTVWVGKPNHDLHVTVLDIGQGDSILIRTPGGNDILIDGGPDSRTVEAVRRNLPPSDAKLDLVVLTHPDLDHVGGLADIASRYKIDRVLETSVRSSSIADQRWERAVDNQHSDRLVATSGQVFHVDDVTLTVLWPTPDADLSKLDRNDTSVVLRVEYGSSSFLLAGDIMAPIEERLLQLSALHSVNVLKVPHHGSISSSTEAFIDALRPEFAAISVGQGNSFGHPHAVVLRRYEKRSMKILRTDQVGDIHFVSDGKSVHASP